MTKGTKRRKARAEWKDHRTFVELQWHGRLFANEEAKNREWNAKFRRWRNGG